MFDPNALALVVSLSRQLATPPDLEPDLPAILGRWLTAATFFLVVVHLALGLS
jgi:hypothetical protein